MAIHFNLMGERTTARRWAVMFDAYPETTFNWGPGDPVYDALRPKDHQLLQSRSPGMDSLTVIVADGDGFVSHERPAVEASDLDPPAKVDTVERIGVRARDIEERVSDDGYRYAVLDGHPQSYDRWSDDDIVSLEWNLPDRRATNDFEFSIGY